MSILNFHKFLEEVNLTLPELGKTRGDSLRGNILVNKLKSGEPITTDKGDTIISKMKDDGNWESVPDAIDNITDDDGNYDPDKAKSYLKSGSRYIKTFKDVKGSEFSVNQFKKTKEFGSKGAGRLIRQFESVQCIFIAIKQANPNLMLSASNLERLFQNFKSNAELKNSLFLPEEIDVNDELIQDFLQDTNWVSTFCKIPNKLFLEANNFVNRNIKYNIFHVASKDSRSPLVSIYKKYSEFAKAGKFYDINFAKFCPADVYLVSKTHMGSISNSIMSTKNIVELSDLIDGLVTKKLLLPLSLKKINKDTPFTIIINKEPGKEMPEFYIDEFIVGSDMKGIGTKVSTTSVWKHRDDKDVDVKNRVINFDSSDTSKKQNIDGEVEGSSSRHGKISFNAISRILAPIYTEYNIQKLETHTNLREKTVEELELEVSDLIGKIKAQSNSISEEPLRINIRPIKRGSDISGNENKLISRIQSLQVSLALLDLYILNRQLAHETITKMMRYALSIQTDTFETPMYLRVI